MGPPPAATSEVPERVPPSPAEGLLRQHDPSLDPIGTVYGPVVFTASYQYVPGL